MTSSPTFLPTSIPTISWLSSSETNIFYIIPICSGLLSVMGSTTIVIMILRQNRLSSTYGRLIFGMSCLDIMQSLAYCFSTLPSPKGADISYLYEWPSFGTSTTCSIQGFFLYTGGTGTTMYFCSLCIYYILAVLKGVTLNSIKHRFELYLHAIPLVFCITCGIFLAATDNFNNAGSVCWIAPFPYECRYNLDTCTRGKNAMLYRWIFQGIPIIICFVIILVCMICLIYNMRRQRNLMKKYKFNLPDDALPNIPRNQHPSYISFERPSSIDTTSKNTTHRALQYIAAFFFTFIFVIISQVCIMFSNKVIFVILILKQITVPAQGFFNFVVFMCPVVKGVQKGDPEISLFKALLKAIISKEKEDENRKDYRSKTDKLRKPNLNRKGFTTRELYQQQKDRDASRFIYEEELKEEEKSFYCESVHSILKTTDLIDVEIKEEVMLP